MAVLRLAVDIGRRLDSVKLKTADEVDCPVPLVPVLVNSEFVVVEFESGLTDVAGTDSVVLLDGYEELLGRDMLLVPEAVVLTFSIEENTGGITVMVADSEILERLAVIEIV